MNSADGIDVADIHQQIIGSHEHFNWGFTSNGVYNITFQVSGQRAGETTNIVSLDSTFRFDVLPLPTNAPPVEIQFAEPLQVSGSGFTFSLNGAENLSIEVQATDDFKTWASVTNLVVSSPSQAITVPTDRAETKQFFRVQQK
jgi:surface-anchored protein